MMVDWMPTFFWSSVKRDSLAVLQSLFTLSHTVCNKMSALD